MFKKVQEYIEKYELIQQGDSIILGISGGADSVCLFFVLLELRKECDFYFYCVHVNHNLRGKDAQKDQRFVESLCREYDIPCESFSVDVQKEAKRRGLSLEEAGRECRRECFNKVKGQLQNAKIATAHHKNDNAETFLMNLVRGTGITGMTGIKPQKGVYIRPLLVVTRDEIENYLLQHKMQFCTDATNKENVYTRNYVRNVLIPGFEKNVNLQAVSHINETISELTKIEQYLNKQVKLAWDHCIIRYENRIEIKKIEYIVYEEIIQERLMIKALTSIAGKQRDISRCHISQLVQLMNLQVGKTIHLPYGLIGLRSFKGIEIKPKESVSSELPEYKIVMGEKQHIVVGTNVAIDLQVFYKKDIENLEETPYTKYFDYDIIKGNLKVRSKRSGDYITINTNGNKQTLKKFFTNNKIEQTERQETVLLALDSEILWVMGYRRCSSFEVGTKTKRVLKVQISKSTN